jgi:hypothetical protein
MEICCLWLVKLTEGTLDSLHPYKKKNDNHFCHVDNQDANFFQPTGKVFGIHAGGHISSYGFNRFS